MSRLSPQAAPNNRYRLHDEEWGTPIELRAGRKVAPDQLRQRLKAYR